MSNAELKKGLDLIIEGLSVISNSLTEEKKAPKKEVAKEEPMNPPIEEETEETEEVTDELDSMKFVDLKKKAKEMGLDSNATRKELIASIREALANGVEEVAEEEPEEEEEKPKKTSKKKEVEEEDEFLKKAKEVAEEESVEDILEALDDVGIKATKKNFLEKLADALRDGLLSLDEDDEDSEEEEEVEEVSDEDDEETSSDIELGEYNPNFDPEGYNDPKVMSKKRKTACKKLVEDTLSKIESGELDKDTILAYLEENLTEDEADLITDDEDEEQLASMYLELLKRTVDVDGNIVDMQEAYEIENETPMCCGHKLKFDKKSKKYICEICGEEYSEE